VTPQQQHTERLCKTQQDTATHCNKTPTAVVAAPAEPSVTPQQQHTARPCKTQQDTARHCNTTPTAVVAARSSAPAPLTVTPQAYVLLVGGGGGG